MTRKDMAAMAGRHLTTVIAVVSIVSGGFVWVVKPRAEQFVRETIRTEQFATAAELAEQTTALRDLAAQVAKQSTDQTALKTDIEAIKSLQRETLRVLLRSERDN